MNLAEVANKLIRVARRYPPSEEVPFGFETRLLGRLRAVPAVDPRAWWGKALWRAAAACVFVALLTSAWSLFSAPSNGATSDLSQELENAVLASVSEADITW